MPQIIARALVEELARCDDEQTARKALRSALRAAGEAGFTPDMPQILSEASEQIERDVTRACGRHRQNLDRAIPLLRELRLVPKG